MESSRLGEDRLVLAQSLGNRRDGLSIDLWPPRRDRVVSGDANRFEGRLPANPARGRHVEVAAQTVRLELNVGPQHRADDVVFLGDPRVGAILDSHEVSLSSHDSFRQQEARGEFEIVPRRTHRDGDRGHRSVALRSRLQSNFHRLLDGEDVAFLCGLVASDLPNFRSGRRSRSLHAVAFAAGTGAMVTRAL